MSGLFLLLRKGLVREAMSLGISECARSLGCWPCANGILASNACSVGFAVPPQELPTIRSRLLLSKPQISPLITDSHGPSSSHCCIGEELMPVCSWADEPTNI